MAGDLGQCECRAVVLDSGHCSECGEQVICPKCGRPDADHSPGGDCPVPDSMLGQRGD